MATLKEVNNKLTDLNNFCDNHKQNIIDAYNCTVSNSCSKINDQIKNILTFISKQSPDSSVWGDDAQDCFDKGINSCIDNLNSISSSISTSWNNAEILYKDNNDKLLKLEGLKNTFNTKINSYPEEMDYMVTDKLPNGKNVITYPGYDNAVLRWQNECNSMVENANDLMNDIVKNIEQLNSINGESIIIDSKINLGAFRTISAIYNDTTVMIDDPNEVSKWLQNNKNYYAKNGYTIRYSQGKGNPWTSKPLYGVNLRSAGCGILSISTALTSTLSEINGSQVIVSPNQVMDGLKAYCDNHNVSLSSIISNKGFQGATEIAAKAISEVWNVDVIISGGSLNKEKTKLAVQGNSAVVYSKKGESHLAAATELTNDDKFVIADTRSGRATYLSGSDEYIAKYFFIISKDTFTEIDGNIYDKDGNLIIQNKQIYSEYNV